MPPSGFLDREAELLETAYELMPKLPFDELDLVVFDRQGKEISGQGLDTNVIGRRPFSINEPAPETPDIKRIFTRGLTEKTHGNAMGVGSADVVHEDVVAELDAQTSLINALTASTIRGVKVPPVVETDRAGIVAALSTIGSSTPTPFACSVRPTRCISTSSTRHPRWSRPHATVTTSESSKRRRRSSSTTDSSSRRRFASSCR